MAPNDNFAYLLPVTMLAFGGTFLVVAYWGSRQARSWGIGYLCVSLAFSVPMTLGWLPVQARTLAADALFLAAFYFYSGALLVRFGRPSFAAARCAFVLAAYASNIYSVLVAESLRGELIVNDFGCAAQLAFAIALCFARARQARDRLLLAVATAVVLETVVRNVILAILLAPGELEGFNSSSYAFFMQFGASILGVLLALAALAAVTLDTLTTYRDAAERDPLSGLLNRRGFERAVAEIGSQKAAGTIVVCDIDHFKRVNDSFGHAAGDRVIMCLADLLRARLPANAFAARFGGEEFVAFLPAATRTEAGQLPMRSGLHSRVSTAATSVSAAGLPRVSESLAPRRMTDRSTSRSVARMRRSMRRRRPAATA